MNEEKPIANPPLSRREKTAVKNLTDADLSVIDAAILAHCSNRWLKVARVVTDTEKQLSPRFPDLTYIFYTKRLAHLAKNGTLESEGNLKYMRFSEVRIPNKTEGI